VDVLDNLKLLRHAPPLIVTSRLADERLWAEALNLGAYDVLAKPFDPQELNRSMNLAFLHWRHSHDTAPPVAKVMRMAR
jgi:DNA-binding response OmpR family regulator